MMQAPLNRQSLGSSEIVLALSVLIICASCNGNNTQPTPVPAPVPPQYTQPGSVGAVVADERVMVETDYGTQFALPATLSCTDTYGLRTEAELQPVNCEVPPYPILFNEAEFALNNRLSQVSCPDACPEQSAQFIRLQADCDPQRSKAWVIATAQVSCQPTNAPELPTLGLPAILPARFDNRLPGVTTPSPLREACATHVEIHFDINGEEIAELCPTSWVVVGTLKVPVASCDAVSDYRPHIARARGIATDLWTRSTCPAPCRKQPARELRSEWSCKEQVPATVNDEVEAKVFIEVSCSEP